jgi:uncharacterized protein YecE (DUF72 family)
MGLVRIGTSGYSYKDWVGPYYPEGTPPREYLSRYALDFDITELNFSYYRMPEPGMLARLVEKTPEGFRFVLKAHRSMTHEPGPRWRDDVRRFADAAAVIAGVGRAGGVLLQFPYSFHYTRENRRYLAALTSSLAEYMAEAAPGDGASAGAAAGDTGGSIPPQPALFVEYRNTEWQRESVYEEMRHRNLALVMTDMPRLRGLPAPDPVITSDRAYLRFHGRNAEAWWEGDNRSRYDYLYSDAELGEWVGPIRSVADQVDELIVMFNNHANAQAVVNAKALIRLLGR